MEELGHEGGAFQIHRRFWRVQTTALAQQLLASPDVSTAQWAQMPVGRLFGWLCRVCEQYPDCAAAIRLSNWLYAAECSTVQQTTQRSAAQHSTAQHSTAQHSTAQHSTAQHSTAQHSTAHHSAAQHSTHAPADRVLRVSSCNQVQQQSLVWVHAGCSCEVQDTKLALLHHIHCIPEMPWHTGG